MDKNKDFLSAYRNKIKQKIKDVAQYNLWYWAIKERYKSHEKLNIILRAFVLSNPCKGWNPSSAQISELLLNNEKYHQLNAYDPHSLRKAKLLIELKAKNDEQKMDALVE